MDLKRSLLSLALTAGLVAPGAALADDDRWQRRQERRHQHQHSASCNHAPAPRPYDAGRYELRTVQQWVDGQYVRDWVPEQCTTRHKRRRTVTRCNPGYYTDRWVPGHYEEVQQWVWVPAPRPGVRVTMHF